MTRGLSSCGSQALERRLSSCGARAQLLRGMWNPPGPGLEPVSPVLAGGFLTTAPPGKPLLVSSMGVVCSPPIPVELESPVRYPFPVSHVTCYYSEVMII